jgi:hypothetical protein
MSGIAPEVALLMSKVTNLESRIANMEAAFVGIQKGITEALKTNQDSVLTIQVAMMFVILRNMGVKDNELRDHVTTYIKLARVAMKSMLEPGLAEELPQPETSETQVSPS